MAVIFVTSLVLWCLLLREKKRHAYQPIEGRRCGGGACLFCCIGGCDCHNGAHGGGDRDGGGDDYGGDGGGGGDDEFKGGGARGNLELAERAHENYNNIIL